jgi:Protein of unknown function (DUF4232)
MHALRQLVRLPVGAVVLAGTAAALTACGSAAVSGNTGPGSTGSSSAGPRATATSGAAAACRTADVQVRLDAGAAGAAAGSSYVPLEFANKSGRPCVLSGYPAVAFATAPGGPQIGTEAVAEQDTHSAGITLAPGAVAHAWLQIADVASYPASRCKPVQAGGLRVALERAQTAAFLPHSFRACASAMPGSTLLAVFPVQPGQAKRGTAP